MNILASVARFELELIKRTLLGVKAARAKGKHIGRPRRVFRRDEAIRLRAGGHSWRSIGKILGVPAMTVRDAVCTESPSTGAEIRDSIQTGSPAA